MVEKQSAAAAGGESLRAAATGSVNQRPALFVGHCVPDYELPFHCSGAINSRGVAWRGRRSGPCRLEEV